MDEDENKVEVEANNENESPYRTHPTHMGHLCTNGIAYSSAFAPYPPPPAPRPDDTPHV